MTRGSAHSRRSVRDPRSRRSFRPGFMHWVVALSVALGLHGIVLTLWQATPRSAALPKEKPVELVLRPKPAPGAAEEKARAEKAAREKAARDAAENQRAAREQAAKLKAAREKAAREQAAREKAAQERAAQQKAAAEKAARERAAREKAAQEKAARERAAREKAAREKAAREKAAREKAAREKAAREKAAREKAAQEKAAREKAAREKAAQERAAQERAAQERAARAQAARERAAREKAAQEKAARDRAAKDRAAKDRAAADNKDPTQGQQALRTDPAPDARPANPLTPPPLTPPPLTPPPLTPPSPDRRAPKPTQPPELPDFAPPDFDTRYRDPDRDPDPQERGLNLAPNRTDTRFARRPARKAPGGLRQEDPKKRYMRLYLQYIQLKMRLHYEYPVAALRRGIGGTVQLFFVIDRNGHLVRYRIVRSSGHKILDDAAITNLRRAAPFRKLPDEIDLVTIPLRFDVNFVPVRERRR